MAADYIVVSRSPRTQLGTQLIRAANLMNELRDLIKAINAIGQRQFTGGDFTMLESQFGLTAGQGANALTLIGLVQTIMNTTTDVTGATRSANLNEFVDRFAGQ